MIDYAELKGRVEFLRNVHQEASDRLDTFYGRTEDMISAMEGGADVDKCLFHWTKLIDELADIKINSTGYYNAHITNLVNMIDETIKESSVKEKLHDQSTNQ